MNNETRREIYSRDRSDLTPAQERRLRHRAGSEQRDTGTARYGRLKRRYEAKEGRLQRARIRLYFALRRGQIQMAPPVTPDETTETTTEAA